jgi:hypothetical protein
MKPENRTQTDELGPYIDVIVIDQSCKSSNETEQTSEIQPNKLQHAPVEVQNSFFFEKKIVSNNPPDTGI